MLPFTPAEVDLLLFIGPPVALLITLVCVACAAWSRVGDEHLNPDEPQAFR